MADDVQTIIGELEKFLEELERLKETEIPSTLKQAIKDEWEGDQVNEIIVNLLPYKNRKEDRKRLVKLKESVTQLQDFEDELVGLLVKNWNSVIIDQVTSLIQGIVSALKNIDTLFRFRSILLYVLKNITEALSMARLSQVIQPSLNMVKRYDFDTPGLLFQRKNPRRRRVKKITRL